MVRPVPCRTVPVPVSRLLAGQQAVERGEQVGIRAGADLHDHQAGGGMGNEDRQQPVTRPDVVEEGRAVAREIGQPASRAGPDGQVASVYGKKLLRASRSRPRPPLAGADS